MVKLFSRTNDISIQSQNHALDCYISKLLLNIVANNTFPRSVYSDGFAHRDTPFLACSDDRAKTSLPR